MRQPDCSHTTMKGCVFQTSYFAPVLLVQC
jgi:hypothetical protein